MKRNLIVAVVAVLVLAGAASVFVAGQMVSAHAQRYQKIEGTAPACPSISP